MPAFFIYPRRKRQRVPGRRMRRTLPLHCTADFPSRTASAVIYFSSDTRMPVAHTVRITAAMRLSPAAAGSRSYSAAVSSLVISRPAANAAITKNEG